MSLPPVRSCTHSHVLHPLCPNFSTLSKAKYLGLAILGAIVVYQGWKWLATKSVTVSEQYDCNRYHALFDGNKKLPFDCQEAFNHAEECYCRFEHDHKSLPKKPLQNANGKFILPLNPNIAYYTTVLDLQKIRIRVDNPQSWKEETVTQEAYKAIEVAYALGCQALEELSFISKQPPSKKNADAHEYCMRIILDSLSLYHVIRSGGSLTIESDRSTTYNCPSTMEEEYSTLFYAKPAKHADRTIQSKAALLYNYLLTQILSNFELPSEWPKFREDSTTSPYICPLAIELPNDGIVTEVRTILNDLLGEKGPVDKIPRLEDIGFLPLLREVTKPIMKFTTTGDSHRAGIAIKMRHDNATSLLILIQTYDDQTCAWKQYKHQYSDALFAESRISPDFFTYFTDESGKLHENADHAYDKLKQLITDGRGIDCSGKEWILVTE
jgi:hypothetical protein